MNSYSFFEERFFQELQEKSIGFERWMKSEGDVFVTGSLDLIYADGTRFIDIISHSASGSILSVSFSFVPHHESEVPIEEYLGWKGGIAPLSLGTFESSEYLNHKSCRVYLPTDLVWWCCDEFLEFWDMKVIKRTHNIYFIWIWVYRTRNFNNCKLTSVFFRFFFGLDSAL